MELERLTDIELLALLIAAEADNQPIEGKVAVACVPVERLRRGRWGSSLRKVILQPYQFSAFNVNSHYMRFAGRIGAHIMLAEMAINSLCNSPTNGATHYHTADILPVWAKSPAMIRRGQIGAHLFYQEQ
jgi:spore germination cell wall hydrolase CwlJ-like protein